MEIITLNNRAATQIQSLIDESNKLSERLNLYVTAVASALDVPPGWQLNINQMAFLPPQAPEDNAKQPLADPE